MSERQACRVLKQRRGTQRYLPWKKISKGLAVENSSVEVALRPHQIVPVRVLGCSPSAMYVIHQYRDRRFLIARPSGGTDLLFFETIERGAAVFEPIANLSRVEMGRVLSLRASTGKGSGLLFCFSD